MPANQPLKVALVYDDSLDGSEGVAQYVKNLGAWLNKRGHRVSYMVGQTRLRQWHGGQIYSLAKNLKVKFNGNRLSIPLPSSPKAIKNALTSADPDILHVQMPHSPFLAQKIINRADVPAIGTFHIFPASWLVEFGSRLLRLIYLRGLGRISRVVSVSPAAQQFAKSAFGIKSEILPNTVELSRYKGAYKQSRNTVVFLGRLVKRKGCRQLIEAFAIVGEMAPEAKLQIGGDGPERLGLEKLVKKLDLQDRVEFKGYIDEKDKPAFLGNATIACFPSMYGESFGIVLIEAMAAGAGAVVGGNNPGYAGVLGDKPELLINPKNTKELAALISRLLLDEHKREEIHKWQAMHVKQFDIEVVGPKIEKIYYSLIANKTAKRHNKTK